MINNLKKVLLQPFNVKMQDYEKQKEKFYKLEEDVLADTSEKDFSESVKELGKKLDKKSEEYRLEYDKLKTEYKNKLDDFNELYARYTKLKLDISKIDIYTVKQNIERINIASTLDELGINLVEAKKLCDDYGFEFEGSLEDLQSQIKKDENNKLKDMLNNNQEDFMSF